MDEIPTRSPAPAGWLEAIAEGEADIAAGRTVSSDAIKRRLLDSIARLETRQDAESQRKTARWR